MLLIISWVDVSEKDKEEDKPKTMDYLYNKYNTKENKYA